MNYFSHFKVLNNPSAFIALVPSLGESFSIIAIIAFLSLLPFCLYSFFVLLLFCFNAFIAFVVFACLQLHF